MLLSHNDPRLSWHGHVSLEQTSSYTRPWRIPFAERSLLPPELLGLAATQAGIRLAFNSDTRAISGRCLVKEQNQLLDLCIDGEVMGSFDLAGKESFAFNDLPAGEKLIELWLPQRGDFALQSLEIDDDASLRQARDDRPRWVTYGSSITHCGSAASPTQTWPAIVARDRNLNLQCLGYGGQCHLDHEMARMMRDAPADFISICVGINIYGQGSLNARSFPASLISFIRTLREKHPSVPLLVISPIFSFERETTPNTVGWTLQDYRNSVEASVGKLRDFGDTHLHYLNGLQLFNETLGHLMPDKLHPDAEGYRLMGKNFLCHAAPLLGI